MRFNRDDTSIKEYQISVNTFVYERSDKLNKSRKLLYDSNIGKSGGAAINIFRMILTAVFSIGAIALIFIAPNFIHQLMYRVLGGKREFLPLVLNILERSTFAVIAILFGIEAVKRYMLCGRIRDVNSLLERFDRLLKELKEFSINSSDDAVIFNKLRKESRKFDVSNSTVDTKIYDVTQTAKRYANEDYGIVSVVQKIVLPIVCVMVTALLFMIATPIALTNIGVCKELLFGKLDINTLALYLSYGFGLVIIVLETMSAINDSDTPWKFVIIALVLSATIVAPFAINALTNLMFDVCTTIYHKTFIRAALIVIVSFAVALTVRLNEDRRFELITEQFLCLAFFVVAVAPFVLMIQTPFLNWVASLKISFLEAETLALKTGWITDIIGIAAYFILTFIITIILFVNEDESSWGATVFLQLLWLLISIPIILIAYGLIYAIIAYCELIFIGFIWLVGAAIVLVIFASSNSKGDRSVSD